MWKLALSAALLFLVGGAAHAAMMPYDVTTPGDPIWLVNGVNDGDGDAGDPPAAEGVEHVIDNKGQKYLNFKDLGSGFIVKPSVGSTVVTGLTFYTANDSEERDPASYELYGSNQSETGPFTLIASGNLSLPSGRNDSNADVTYPNTLFSESVSFANTDAYAYYEVVFPTLKNAAAANSMQIGEVDFYGVTPEPATLALLGLGGLVTLIRRRRR
jgi:hypothetical protein